VCYRDDVTRVFVRDAVLKDWMRRSCMDSK
jgi:hypothetical protein